MVTVYSTNPLKLARGSWAGFNWEAIIGINLEAISSINQAIAERSFVVLVENKNQRSVKFRTVQASLIKPMSNNTSSRRSNESLDEPVGSPLDAKLDEPSGETEDERSVTKDVGSPTEDERSPTVDLDEL